LQILAQIIFTDFDLKFFIKDFKSKKLVSRNFFAHSLATRGIKVVLHILINPPSKIKQTLLWETLKM
jgi:hypothetical protein